MAGSYTYPQGLPNDIEGVKQYLTDMFDVGFTIGAKTRAWQPKANIRDGLLGASQVLLATMDTSGLGNYDKAKGFTVGTTELSWKAYDLKHDRSSSFVLDRIDVMDTKGLESADALINYFVTQKVVPEQDAIAIASAVSLASPANILDYTPSTASIVSTIEGILDDLENVTGIDGGYNILFNGKYKKTLTQSEEVQKTRDVFAGGGYALDARINSISGSGFTFVPSTRMFSAFDLFDGQTSGQEDGGFAPATGAKEVLAVISAPNTLQNINKVNVTNIFPMGIAQDVDGSKIQTRIHYDTILQDGDKPGVFVITVPST